MLLFRELVQNSSHLSLVFGTYEQIVVAITIYNVQINPIILRS